MLTLIPKNLCIKYKNISKKPHSFFTPLSQTNINTLPILKPTDQQRDKNNVFLFKTPGKLSFKRRGFGLRLRNKSDKSELALRDDGSVYFD